MDMVELLAGKKVLVVDDQKLGRHIVGGFFLDKGFTAPVMAENGAEALEQLMGRSHEFAVIIADFNMPAVNGLQLLKAVRCGFGDIRTDLPLIMLTGSSDGPLVGAAIALDVDAFIVKPVSKNALMTRIHQTLTATRVMKRLEEYEAVDLDEVLNARRKLKLVPEDPAEKPHQEAAPPPSGRQVALHELELPATLGQDICAPSGELLLSAGTNLTRRLVDRLLELRDFGIPLDTVWVAETRLAG